MTPTGGGCADRGADGSDDVGAAELPVDGPESVAEERLLASFGRQARAVNLARVVRLGELLDSAAAGVLDEAGRCEAESLAHQVVGSAGTFGFASASVEAMSVENYFATLPAGTGAEAALVRSTLDRLQAQFGG